MNAFRKYLLSILISSSICVCQITDPLAIQDLLECPEVFEYPWYNDFVYYPDLPNNPPAWLFDEIIIQKWSGTEWENQSRLRLSGPQHDALGIILSNWDPTDTEWKPQNVMNLYWQNGKINYWTVKDPYTGNDVSVCYFSGHDDEGVPSVESYWKYDGTQLEKYMDVTTTKTTDSKTIKYDCFENNCILAEHTVTTTEVYKWVMNDGKECPSKQTFSEKAVDWVETKTVERIYDSVCGNNSGTFDPTDIIDCAPITTTVVSIPDGSLVASTQRSFSYTKECTTTQLRYTDEQEGKDLLVAQEWRSSIPKVNNIDDVSDFRLVKIEAQESDDGINWTNYMRAWISYDGIQMDAEIDVFLPINFELKQNYPNPFNPLTTISYEVPNESNVIIKVYNSLGNEIKTILNDNKQTGQYAVVWDGTNDSGSKVSGGTYFIHLKAGDYSETKKMVLLK